MVAGCSSRFQIWGFRLTGSLETNNTICNLKRTIGFDIIDSSIAP